MSGENFLFEEFCYSLGISFSNGSCFWPSRNVLSGHNKILVTYGYFRHVNNINCHSFSHRRGNVWVQHFLHSDIDSFLVFVTGFDVIMKNLFCVPSTRAHRTLGIQMANPDGHGKGTNKRMHGTLPLAFRRQDT